MGETGSWGYEIILREKRDADGNVTRKAEQIKCIASGLMEQPTREGVLFDSDNYKLVKGLGVPLADVEVFVNRPFGESPAK